jgi:hypothetical protein
VIAVVAEQSPTAGGSGDHSVAEAIVSYLARLKTNAIPVLNLVARAGDGPRRVEG